jgi:HSP20 family molecular chaperone IbpA
MEKIIIDKALKENLPQIVLANTVNGGITQVQVKLAQSKEGYHASFAMPSAEEDTFRVLLNNQHLEVYRLLRIINQVGELVEMSMLISAFLVPPFVDIERIEATYETGSLHLFAPFREGTQPQAKEIPINQK